LPRHFFLISTGFVIPNTNPKALGLFGSDRCLCWLLNIAIHHGSVYETRIDGSSEMGKNTI
jgi:hypothetical protein